MSITALILVFELLSKNAFPGLSATERWLLALLANYARQDGSKILPSQYRMARETKLSVRTIRVALHRLLKADVGLYEDAPATNKHQAIYYLDLDELRAKLETVGGRVPKGALSGNRSRLTGNHCRPGPATIADNPGSVSRKHDPGSTVRRSFLLVDAGTAEAPKPQPVGIPERLFKPIEEPQNSPMAKKVANIERQLAIAKASTTPAPELVAVLEAGLVRLSEKAVLAPGTAPSVLAMLEKALADDPLELARCLIDLRDVDTLKRRMELADLREPEPKMGGSRRSDPVPPD